MVTAALHEAVDDSYDGEDSDCISEDREDSDIIDELRFEVAELKADNKELRNDLEANAAEALRKDRIIKALHNDVARKAEIIKAFREKLSDIAQRHQDYDEWVTDALSQAEDHLVRDDCEYK